MANKRVKPALRLKTALRYVAGTVSLKEAAEVLNCDHKNVSAYLGTQLLRSARDGDVAVRRVT